MSPSDDVIIEDLCKTLKRASELAKELNQKYPKLYNASNYSFKALKEVEEFKRRKNERF